MKDRPRIRQYWTKWRELTETYGDMCFYCRDAAATSIDHVRPHSWDADDRLENLRPSCGLCNSIASDKMFDSVDEKRNYILRQLQDRRTLRRCACSECAMPYTYRTHSPSLFLCAECYDLEYGTRRSKSRAWAEWLELLTTAEIFPEVHRRAGNYYRPIMYKGKSWLRECLIRAVYEVEAEQLGEAMRKAA